MVSYHPVKFDGLRYCIGVDILSLKGNISHALS